MHFMYVDESGDPGQLIPGVAPHLLPSPHYILSGVIIADRDWRNYLTALVDIRKTLRSRYGLPARAELHGAELFRPRSAVYKGLGGGRRRRMDIYRDALSLIASRLGGARIINVHLNKATPNYPSNVNLADIQGRAWEYLLQRFHNHLTHENEMGIVFADDTNEPMLRKLLRRMRAFNFVPSMLGSGGRSLVLDRIIEDPIMRRSEHSFFVQIADLASHALYRKLYPKGAYRRYNAERFFDLLCPLMHPRASLQTPINRALPRLQGVVHM